MPDLPYNRPEGRRRYLSISKHQQHAKNGYAKWKSVPIERSVFDTGDYGNFQLQEGMLAWLDDNQNMWGFLKDHPEVGVDKEQFGFFQNPNNAQLEWHGFPIIPFSQKRYEIPDHLLTRWVQQGCIAAEDIPAIKNKKRI